MPLRPDEIVITNGGLEAVYLALRTVASAGDTIVLESPTYFHLLQVIESLGMRALEIPTHPRDGISLEALEFATREPGAVKACVLLPNFPNPMGSLMPVERKQALVQLARERGITLIESDIYGELHFGEQRPPVLKSFDAEADIILCSAFTKTVAPGYRIGWVAPGRHFLKTQALKFRTSVACPMLTQEVLAQFIRDGGYDHLRKLRAALKTQMHQMVDAVARHFPMGCRMSLPQGGMMLWIELPKHVDSREVFALAAAGAHRRRPGRGLLDHAPLRPLHPPAVRRAVHRGHRGSHETAGPHRQAAGRARAVAARCTQPPRTTVDRCLRPARCTVPTRATRGCGWPRRWG